MDKGEIINEFISGLKTIAIKAREEEMSVQAIHARIKRGVYKTIDICGITFIVDPAEQGEDMIDNE